MSRPYLLKILFVATTLQLFALPSPPYILGRGQRVVFVNILFCILDHNVLPPPFQNIIIERVRRQEEARERTEQTLAALSLSLFDNVSLRVTLIQEPTVIMARS